MSKPREFWSAVNATGSSRDALYYAWLVNGIGACLYFPVLTRVWGSLLLATLNVEEASFGQLSQLDEPARPGQLTEVLDSARAQLNLWNHSWPFWAVAVVLVLPLLLVSVAAIIHLFCLALDAGKNGYTATLRVVAFSSAPVLLCVIPCFDLTVYPVYWAVLMSRGLAALQDVSLRRATSVIVLATAVIACCLGGASVLTLVPAAFHR